MNVPVRFPDPRQLAAERAREFQQLEPDARWRELAALWKFGWSMVDASPRRAAIIKRMEEQEADWRRLQTDLFRRHAQ